MAGSVRALAVLGVGLVFFALFGKDIAAQFFLGFERRNFYGAAFFITGCALCFASIVDQGRLRSFLSALLSPLLLIWAAMLLIIAPATSYLFRGSFYISPQAVGFVGAVVCFLASPNTFRQALVVTLSIQFVLMLIEYDVGFSLTLSKNETLGYDLSEWGWIIDTKANLVRAKGLLDSTHDAAWLFLYSTFIFPTSIVLLVVTAIASWMSMARLCIIVTAALVAASEHRLKAAVLVMALAGAAFVLTPEKMFAGSRFFIEAFNPTSTSNAARIEATKASIQYLLSRVGIGISIKAPEPAPEEERSETDDGTPLHFANLRLPSNEADALLEDRSIETRSGDSIAGARSILGVAARAVFGVSGLVFVAGAVATESSYTLFSIEYGFLGLALLIWTVAKVVIGGRPDQKRLNLVFGATMAVVMASSSIQSASSFFMFWAAIFHLVPIVHSGAGEMPCHS